MPFNINNPVHYYSFICIQFNGFKYRKGLNISICRIDLTRTCTTTPGQSGPGGNGNEEVIHITQSSRTEALPSESLVSYQDAHWLVGILPIG